MAPRVQPIARIREGRGPDKRAPLAGLLAALDLPVRAVAEALATPNARCIAQASPPPCRR
jgi:hypothetical protein